MIPAVLPGSRNHRKAVPIQQFWNLARATRIWLPTCHLPVVPPGQEVRFEQAVKAGRALH